MKWEMWEDEDEVMVLGSGVRKDGSDLQKKICNDDIKYSVEILAMHNIAFICIPLNFSDWFREYMVNSIVQIT